MLLMEMNSSLNGSFSENSKCTCNCESYYNCVQHSIRIKYTCIIIISANINKLINALVCVSLA